MTNREAMQNQSVAIKGFSFRLFNEDWTTFVPAECSSVSYCYINVYIDVLDVHKNVYIYLTIRY